MTMEDYDLLEEAYSEMLHLPKTPGMQQGAANVVAAAIFGN
jgi:hypothetical protein